jgi:hypothetical protein
MEHRKEREWERGVEREANEPVHLVDSTPGLTDHPPHHVDPVNHASRRSSLVRLVDTLKSGREQPLALSEDLGRVSEGLLGDARDLLHLFGVVDLDDVLELVEADSVLLDELSKTKRKDVEEGKREEWAIGSRKGRREADEAKRGGERGKKTYLLIETSIVLDEKMSETVEDGEIGANSRSDMDGRVLSGGSRSRVDDDKLGGVPNNVVSRAGKRRTSAEGSTNGMREGRRKGGWGTHGEANRSAIRDQRTVPVAAGLWPTRKMQSVVSMSVSVRNEAWEASIRMSHRLNQQEEGCRCEGSKNIQDPGCPSHPKFSRIEAAAVAVQSRVLPSMWSVPSPPFPTIARVWYSSAKSWPEV